MENSLRKAIGGAITSLLMLISCATADAALTLAVNNATVQAGNTFQVAVQQTVNGTTPATIFFKLHYDPAYVTIQSVTKGAVVSDANKTFYNRTLSGGYEKIIITGNDEVLADGVLATFEFSTAAGTDGIVSPLSITDYSAATPSPIEAIPMGVTNAQVTIVSNAAEGEGEGEGALEGEGEGEGEGTGVEGEGEGEGGTEISTYRHDMRNFIYCISDMAKALHPSFAVVPQNGLELFTWNGESSGPVVDDYVAAVDGVGREDLLYGYTVDNEATPADVRDYFLGFTELVKTQQRKVLAIDYCSTASLVDASYQQNTEHDYISFAANHRDLDVIPSYPAAPYNENTANIQTIQDARNFLYLINPDTFGSKESFLSAVAATNYDLLVIDAFYDQDALTSAEIARLQTKANGGHRLVLAYMSIGEAESYRYYWNADWAVTPPDWLAGENPDWPGNYKVRYWMPGWQAIMVGNADSYLNRILAAGFDGVYLDLVDAFEYFENIPAEGEGETEGEGEGSAIEGEGESSSDSGCFG